MCKNVLYLNVVVPTGAHKRELIDLIAHLPASLELSGPTGFERAVMEFYERVRRCVKFKRLKKLDDGFGYRLHFGSCVARIYMDKELDRFALRREFMEVVLFDRFLEYQNRVNLKMSYAAMIGKI